MSPVQTEKAKSRLANSDAHKVSETTKSIPSEPAKSATPETTTVSAHHKTTSFTESKRYTEHEKRPAHHERSQTSGSALSSFWSTRLRFLLLLFLGLLGYAICAYILRVIHPEQIANIVFYQSYLPLLGAAFFAHFFFCSFLFLHSRRAFLASLSLTLILFLKLQDVVLSPVVLATIFGSVGILELFFTFIFKNKK